MREQEVSVICREQDTELVKAVIPKVTEKYKELTGINANISVEKRHKLAPGPKEGHKGPSWYVNLFMFCFHFGLICYF